MLGFPLVYFKGMRLMMFQLSGFYYRVWDLTGFGEFVGVSFRFDSDQYDYSDHDLFILTLHVRCLLVCFLFLLSLFMIGYLLTICSWIVMSHLFLLFSVYRMRQLYCVFSVY